MHVYLYLEVIYHSFSPIFWAPSNQFSATTPQKGIFRSFGADIMVAHNTRFTMTIGDIIYKLNWYLGLFEKCYFLLEWRIDIMTQAKPSTISGARDGTAYPSEATEFTSGF
jgi:hypothetical protein